MAEITLPRAGPNRSGRRGGARLPSAQDVPTVRPPTDPGLRVPAGAFGGFEARALEGLGQSAVVTGVRIDNELKRQQRRHDAIKTGELRNELERQWVEELQRRRVEESPAPGKPGHFPGPTDPKFMSDFETFMKQGMEAGITGLEDVSEGGLEDLRLKLGASINRIAISAGDISLAASSAAAEDVIEGAINKAAAQAVRDPDALLDILADIKGRLDPFKGTLTADQERDQLEKARAGVILGAIEGYARAGDRDSLDTAELILASGVFDEDLSPAQRARAENMIKVGENDARLALERGEKELKEAQALAREETASQFTARLWDPAAEPLTYADVIASNLKSTQKRTYLALLDKGQATSTNRPLYNELFAEVAEGAILADQMAERVLPFLGKGITAEDYSRLRTFAGKIAGDGSGQALKRFMTMAKSQITGSNLFTNDPVGDRLLYEFQFKFDQRLEREMAAGASISDLLNPESPNYLGPMINNFFRTNRQQIQDRAKALRGRPPIPAP